MKLRPLKDRVLVRRVAHEAKSSGGIITRTPRKKSRWKAKSSPSTPVRVMRMAFCTRSTSRPATACCSAKWLGSEIKLDGEDLMIMKESDIDEAAAIKKAA